MCVCDHEGRRRFVAVDREKTTLVAKMEQCATMRARQEEECQEVREVIKYMKERQGKPLATTERKQKLMSEAPEDIREILQENRDLDEKEDLCRGD